MKVFLMILRKFVRFIAISICSIIGLIILLFVFEEVSMISHSFIDQELNRMGLYEDLPDFPSYRICGFRHRWSRGRYDYRLKLSSPIGSAAIAKIDSLCKTYEGHLRWHYDEDKGQYTLFLWDIAKDYNDYLMIRPGENKIKFVYEPFTRYPTKENDDLFTGPIYGEARFYELQQEQKNTE